MQQLATVAIAVDRGSVADAVLTEQVSGCLHSQSPGDLLAING
ncbi:MAG: hypothetical protein ACRDS9_18205 [Pseudonocardiaceae bacterium]